jgi:putative glycosyltransferase (TIGR04372 family)
MHRATTLPMDERVRDRRNDILSHLSEPERPYVVFTVREFDSLNQESDLRNRRIADFGPSMTELVSRGFNVIRLMSKTKDPLVGVDRHHLDWQVERDGEFGDELAVLSGAEFVVSTTTGGDCLALAYRRPVLYLDCFRFPLVFLGTELTTFSVPLMFDSNSGQRIGMKTILERGLGWVGDQRLFSKAGVQLSQSDSQRIRSQIIEYVDALSSKDLINQDLAQQLWRDMLNTRLGSEIAERHGEIKAKMLRSSLSEFVI